MKAHARRVRIRRKDLRQPDEFTTLAGQAGAWISAHRTTAILAGAILLVVLVGGAGMARYRAARDESAAGEFRTAHQAFQGGKLQEAAAAFEVIAGEYPGTPFGRLSRLYLGHALARQGENAAAADAYQSYLDTSIEAVYLRQEALAGLGHAREAAGDATGALEAYEAASDLGGPYRTDALLGIARLKEASGDQAAAVAIYARLLEETADGELKAMLMGKLPPEARAKDAADEDTPIEP